MTRSYSLHRRVLRGFVLPLVLAGLAGIVLTGWIALGTINRGRDMQIRLDALLLAELTRHEAAEGEIVGVLAASQVDQPTPGPEFHVRAENGSVIASRGMPALPMASTDGFRWLRVGSVTWRSYTVSEPETGISVEVAEPLALRRRAALAVVGGAAVPMVVLIAAVAAFAGLLLRRTMSSLAQLSIELDRRSAEELRPIEVRELPVEIAPMVHALDGLLARMRTSLDREREFSDNAAHELRTPLAVLKTRAQLVQAALAGVPEQAAQAAALAEAVDRAVAVIDQLLRLGRSLHPEALTEPFDLSEAVGETARELAPAALGQDRRLKVDIAPGILFCGNREAIQAIVHNLLENAIKFTPARGRIGLKLAVAEGGGVRIEVTDTGPGVPPGEEARIFERFRRGGTEIPGSGLGLAIVERLADLHGGRAHARRRAGGGLSVVVDLPSSRLPAQPAAVAPVARDGGRLAAPA